MMHQKYQKSDQPSIYVGPQPAVQDKYCKSGQLQNVLLITAAVAGYAVTIATVCGVECNDVTTNGVDV